MPRYRYPHFQRELLMEDFSFDAGPSPGEPMPDFELTTVDGGTVRKSDFVGERPLFLTFGSITCPMTSAASETLKQLHREVGDRVAFVTLYVREAHPGEEFPQARTMEQKRTYAGAYKDRDGIEWPVAVDDIDGSLHRRLDPKPNAAYIMARDGRVAYRSLWSNDEGALRKGLGAIAEAPDRIVGETESRVVPMISGMGEMRETLEISGTMAKRDAMKEAPPMYAMASIASVFESLSPLQRGMAAVAVTGLGVYGLVRGIRRLSRQIR